MATQLAVGIDLGTTFSVAAYLDGDGRPVTVPNAEGDLTTPSVVLFDDSSIVVGKEAVKAAAMEPDHIAEFPKRDMGNVYFSQAIGGEYFPPEVIQSLILEKLKRDAEEKIGSFDKAVITVPAFFNEPRRKATQDAGQLAGLEVLDIINEPTAAAVAYGTRAGFLTPEGESRRTEQILVYDLGGGTFDVTLMEIDGRDYKTVATAGDVYLGGIDWDQRIADHVAERFQEKYRGNDPRKNPNSLKRLVREAEDAKRTLTARQKTTISYEQAGEGVRVPITRDQFEELTSDLLQRTRFTVRSVLKDAGVAWQDITRLMLVGGATRMPMVRRMLEEESGIEVDVSLSADEAVAHGAALYAGILLSTRSGSEPNVKVQNVNPHNLGVLARQPKTQRRQNCVLIPRNSRLPVSKAERFKTRVPNQRQVSVRVVEGGDSTGQNSTLIGKCVVTNLPDGLPAGTPVDVYFWYAANGRLTVRAHLPDSGREAQITIERDTGLTNAKLREWDQRLRNRAAILNTQ